MAGALAVVAVLAIPGATRARDGGALLDGTPLNVFSDGLGALQVRQDGVSAGLFYDPDQNPAHAGLEIKEGSTYYPLEDVFSTAPGRVSAEPISITDEGGGTKRMHTAYTVGPDLKVSEDTTYTDGTAQINIHYAIQNISAAPVSLRAGALADLYVGNNDSGNGVLSTVAPRFVGGQDPANQLVYGLQEVTPWRTFQEGDFESVFANFADSGLNNTVDSGAPDNGVGVDFALDNIAPGDTRAIDVRWLLASPAPPGTYSPPPLTNTNPGGIGSTAATIDQLPPPVVGKSANVSVRKGRIFIKIPPSNAFFELKGAMQIPVGATIDSRQGRVNLQTAANRSGKTQLAWFYSGVFKVGQDKGTQPITNVTLAEELAKCTAGKSASASASAKKPKTRKLWGEGKGAFRTSGNFSSATVRGTRWLVTDRCDVTETKVAEGVVTVRDFVKRKTVVVRAGKTYFARKKK